MVDISKIRVDADAEQNGRWIPWKYGIRLLIARMNTVAFQERMREKCKPLAEKVRSGDEAAIREVNIAVMAECTLLGWEGIEEDGKPLEYTPEVGVRVLSDEGLRDLYEFVLLQSDNRSNFLVEEGN